MNDRVKFELLEEVAGLAAADALERAAAPTKQQRNRGLCNMLVMIGGRDAAIRVLAGRTQVNEAGCHIWQGMKDYNGYGRVYAAKRNLSVHRLQYEISNGPIPATGSPDGIGWMVLHKCDVPACCNPEHLYLGTAKQNARDAADRCRIRRGYRVFTDGANFDRKNEYSGTIFYEIEGVVRSLAEWSASYEIPMDTFERRLECGWPVAHLSLPLCSGVYHYKREHEYQRFAGEAAVMEYMVSKAGDG